MKQTIDCPHCPTKWDLPVVGPHAYDREALKVVAIEAATHLRSEHTDETMALRLERWAVSPTPGRTRSASFRVL